MTEAHEERWEVYPSRIEDEFAMFAVNLGPHRDAPFDNLRWLNIVRLPFEALPSGMPSADTNSFLYEVEDFVSSKASSRGGIQVGRLTVGGRRELFFYAATNDADLILRDLNDEFGDIDADVLGNLDAEWKVYFEFLYPQPIDFQRIHNQKVVRLLGEHGDNLEIPRQIDHFAYFPDAETRRAFAHEVVEGGFEIESETEADEGDLRFALAFSSHGPVELAAIDQATIGLFLKADELGGRYDGWGCPVQKPGDDEGE